MNQLKIHDIKDLVIISDYSLYIFILLVVLATLTITLLIYLIVKKIFNKKENIKKRYLKKLKELDFSNTKESAYAITKYGKYFIDEQRVEKLYFELNENLNPYKYKKDIEPFHKEIKEEIRRFMDAIDV